MEEPTYGCTIIREGHEDKPIGLFGYTWPDLLEDLKRCKAIRGYDGAAIKSVTVMLESK